MISPHSLFPLTQGGRLASPYPTITIREGGIVTLEQFEQAIMGYVSRVHRRLFRFSLVFAKNAKARSKSILGTRFQGMPPFIEPWPPLAAATIEDKLAHGYSVPSPLLRTGEMEESIDVEVEQAGMGTFRISLFSTSDYSPYHEFGFIHWKSATFVGPRPFIAPGMIGEFPTAEEQIALNMIASLFPPTLVTD